MLTKLAHEYTALGPYTKLLVDSSPFIVAIVFWLLGMFGEALFKYSSPSKLRTCLRTTGLLIASVLAFGLFALFIQARVIGIGNISTRYILGVGFIGGVCVYLAFGLWKDDRDLVKKFKKIDDLEAQMIARLSQIERERET